MATNGLLIIIYLTNPLFCGGVIFLTPTLPAVGRFAKYGFPIKSGMTSKGAGMTSVGSGEGEGGEDIKPTDKILINFLELALELNIPLHTKRALLHHT